jgi:hypothetical protein
MDQPTRHIPPLDTQAIGGLVGRIGPRVRRPEIETAVGLLGVVVGSVDPKNPLQMSAAEHERPVEALGPDGPDPSFGEGVRPRSPDRGVDDLDALGCEHRVEAGGVLRVLVPDQEPEDAAAGEVEGQVPPCWVTQAASGFLVAPATWTRLVWSSITKTSTGS